MINVQVVLYDNTIQEIFDYLEYFIESDLVKKIFFIDNSNKIDEEIFYQSIYVNSKISKYKGKINFIESKGNIGFGSGHNILFDYTKINTDLIIVSNLDCFFNPEDLKSLVYSNFYEIDSKIGIVAPRQRNLDLREYHLSYYGDSFLYFLLGIFIKIFCLDNYLYRKISNENFNYCAFVSGSFMMINKKVIETKIKFDERFFLYMEDLDFCRTVRKKGFKILENKNVMIIHNANRLSRNSFKYVILHIKSMIKYFSKWGFF